MQNIEIKKTQPTDFEKIYPLLQEFHSHYSFNDWKRIFTYCWEGKEDCIGYHLEHKNSIVGFMGLIFSYRYIKNKKYQFCNITSLIVKEEHRPATLFLLRKLKQYNNVIFTGLRPIKESYRLLEKLGFISFEKSYKILPTINQFLRKKNKIRAYESPNLLNKVTEENKRIAFDHMKLNCEITLLENSNLSILLVYKITKQKHYMLTITKIHLLYISNIALFNKNIFMIFDFFNKKYGFLSALYIDSRFLHQQIFYFSIEKKISPPKIYYSSNDIEISDIDELYSENVLL